MSENIRTLRPGLLVSLNTSIRGNVHYLKVDLEGRHVDVDGSEIASWEMTRTISDPAEHVAAVKLRSQVRGLVLTLCSQSAFGLLCREDNADRLREAITAARALADQFNATATLTNVSVNVLVGRIAQDDVEAVRAISEEIRSLMEDMQTGLSTLDVKAVRDAANKAKSLGEMLSDDAKGRLDVAITAARKSARAIVKAGETVAVEIDRNAIAQIDMARTSFLDLDMASVDIGTPEMDGRALDMETPDPLRHLVDAKGMSKYTTEEQRLIDAIEAEV